MEVPSLHAATEQRTKLSDFRQAAYQELGPGRAVLQELVDAALLTPSITSFVALTQAPVFRRGWASAYQALARGHPDPDALLAVYARYLPPVTGERLLAGDHTAMPRVKAYTLADRSVQHQPDPVPGNHPV